MTTLAMIFGMLPMAIGMGDGGEQQAPMGRAVIGGVITSTLLTLGKRAVRWFKKGAELDAHPEPETAGRKDLEVA